MEKSLVDAVKGDAELVQAILGNHRMFDAQLGALVIPTLSWDKGIAYLPKVIEQLEHKGNYFSSSLAS
jgi:hypothetical protein